MKCCTRWLEVTGYIAWILPLLATARSPADLYPSPVVSNITAELTQHQQTEVIGDTTYENSFGLFPRGCKWRVGTKANSSEVSYQFWEAGTPDGRWVDARPAVCSPQGVSKPGPPDYRWWQGSPRTQMICQKAHCTYYNMYYNNGRWYALVDGLKHIQPWAFSRNQQVGTLHVKDAGKFLDSVQWNIVQGDSLLFDFMYFTHPTAIGHWWEMLAPLFSILKSSARFRRPCDQFVLLHLHRKHVFEWVRAMIAVTLGVGLQDQLPPILFQEPSDNAWTQVTQLLEGYERGRWYIFERLMVVKDTTTKGYTTFLSTEHAQEFRGLIYQQYGLPRPTPRTTIPRLITWQRKTANRRVINEDQLVELLQQYGEVQIVQYNSSSSLHEQLLQMQRTGVFVSVHTSNLANSPLLQPGSAVIEIIQRHWGSSGMDTAFKEHTVSMYDIHHFALRCQRLNQTVYLDPRDLAKVGNWTSTQCNTQTCIEAHTNVDVIVDIPELKALLDSRLPLVFNGTETPDAEIDWPSVSDED